MKPPLSNCCKGPKSDTETDFAIKSEEMDWEERLIELYTHSSNYEDVVDFVKEIRAEAMTTAVKETEKAFGGCKKCYGKGYATYRHGTRISADFIGDRSYTTPQETHMLFCVCERGKALEKLIQPK